MFKASTLSLSLSLLAVAATPLYAGVTLKADTYVSATNPSTNFGASTLINVGAGNSGLLQYDLSPILSRLLPGVTPATVAPIIGKATLTVFVNKAAVAGTLSAAPLLNSWTESTVTNSSLPNVGAVVAGSPVTTGGQFVTLDITPLVQGWLSNNNDSTSPNYTGGGNFGLTLTSPDGGVFILDSKEGTTTSHAATLDIDLAANFTGILHKDLPFAAPPFGITNLMSIHLTGTNTATGRIFYNVHATDGGNQSVTEGGVLQFAASANEITCRAEATDKIHFGTVNSACSLGFYNPGSQPGIGISDEVSFSTPATPVVNEVFFRIDNLSGAVIRLEP